MKRRFTDLRPSEYVWLASTWRTPVVHDRARGFDDREITLDGTTGERTGALPIWAFTVCGILVAEPRWEPGWSEMQTPPRFAVGPSRGNDLPLRLLNPAAIRPCRRCFNIENG